MLAFKLMKEMINKLVLIWEWETSTLVNVRNIKIQIL